MDLRVVKPVPVGFAQDLVVRLLALQCHAFDEHEFGVSARPPIVWRA